MISNRITSQFSDDNFVIRYYLGEIDMMTIASDYSTTSVVIYENCPYRTIELFNIIFPKANPVGYIAISPVVITVKLVGEDNIFEFDFSEFNETVFGLKGVRDFIFDNESLKKLMQ
jgi:hypothetical protein